LPVDIRELIFAFDQEPVVWLTGDADEGELAADLLAEESEDDLALVILQLRVDERLIFSAVPDAYLARTVGAFGERTLELEVAEAVIRNGDREPLTFRVHRRPLPNRPRFPRPVDLKPQIEMQPRRVMLVDHEPLSDRLVRRLHTGRHLHYPHGFAWPKLARNGPAASCCQTAHHRSSSRSRALPFRTFPLRRSRRSCPQPACADANYCPLCPRSFCNSAVPFSYKPLLQSPAPAIPTPANRIATALQW